MHVFIDNPQQFRQCAVTYTAGIQQTYYLASKPHLALVVCLNGLRLNQLRGKVAIASTHLDRGEDGLIAAPGKIQQRIIIRSLAHVQADARLSEILKQSPIW
jgi:hypothetical protein